MSEGTPRASVILLYYNHWDLTHQRMGELYRFAPAGTEIILLDNHSDDVDCQTGGCWWAKNMNQRHIVRYYRTKRNGGFGYGHNVGAKLARGEVLIFLSNDVKIEYDFVSDILGRLEDNPRALVGGRLLDFDTGWNKFGDVIVPYLEGWLLACRREVWQELGGFDLRYRPCDYEDMDLSYSASRKGIALIELNTLHLKHLGGRTIGYGDKRSEITLRNREKFRDKWGLP